MFGSNRSRVVGEVSKGLSPFARAATVYTDHPVEENSFLLGLIGASSSVVFPALINRNPTQKEFGQINALVLKNLFPNNWKTVGAATTAGLQAADPNITRGMEAAGIFWRVAYGIIDIEHYPILIMLNDQADEFSEYSELLGLNPSKNDYDRLLSVIIVRMGEEISGGSQWDDLSSLGIQGCF